MYVCMYRHSPPKGSRIGSAMTLLLLIVAVELIWSSASVTANPANPDMIAAVGEMQKANYFAFVMLVNMAPPDLIQANITFLMPNDRTLSKANVAETSVVDFLLRHSIPWPLLIEHLEHFPTGSLVPTSRPGFVLKVTNDGRRRFFLNNVRIVSPNICTKGSSIRCHGVDGVVQPALIPDDHSDCPSPPPSPPPPTTTNNATLEDPSSPPSLAPPSAVVDNVGRPKSTSHHAQICNAAAAVASLVVTIFFML